MFLVFYEICLSEIMLYYSVAEPRVRELYLRGPRFEIALGSWSTELVRLRKGCAVPESVRNTALKVSFVRIMTKKFKS
jgi:hypothetical protein